MSNLSNNTLDHVRVGFWVLGLKEKTFFSFKNIFLLEGKTNNRDNIIFNQVFFFLRPAEKLRFWTDEKIMRSPGHRR